MDLETTVKTNKKIMALIKGKYPEVFPTGYNNADYRYYMLLDNENAKAERYLEIARPK